MIRLVVVAALLLPVLLCGSGSALGASSAPFCSGDATPTVDASFGALQAVLGHPFGPPIECAHPVLAGDIIVQHLADGGGLVLNLSNETMTYTDGEQFNTLDASGTLNVSSEPPEGVLRALLAALPLTPAAAVETPAPVATSSLAPASSPVPVPNPIVAPHIPVYAGDPRLLVVGINDMPGGARHWILAGQDTTRLLQLQYTITYAKLPDDGAVFPWDPMVAINIFVTDSVESAVTTWSTLAKPAPGQRAGIALAPIADDQFYVLGINSIDVRARRANVIIQAVEWTAGTNPISLDDTVTLVRIMSTRVAGLSQ